MNKLPLPQLRDIHLPAEPSMWPLAIGWWIVLVLLIVIVVLLFIKIRQYKKFKRYQTELLKQFEYLEASFRKKPCNQSIAKINTLLRQVAVNTYPREDTASLTGNDWLTFLDKSGNTNKFTQGEGKVLIEAPYQMEAALNEPNTSFHHDKFITLTRAWIKKQIATKMKSTTSAASTKEEVSS